MQRPGVVGLGHPVEPHAQAICLSIRYLHRRSSLGSAYVLPALRPSVPCRSGGPPRQQRPSALDVFTGREELFAAFEQALERQYIEDRRIKQEPVAIDADSPTNCLCNHRDDMQLSDAHPLANDSQQGIDVMDCASERCRTAQSNGNACIGI